MILQFIDYFRFARHSGRIPRGTRSRLRRNDVIVYLAFAG